MTTLIAAVLLAASPALAAETCDAQRARLGADLAARLRFDERRALTRSVQAALTPAENAELAALSARFNATPHAGAGVADRFAMQARARELTRAAALRSGRRPRNLAQGPYDAVVEEIEIDGVPTATVEVRSLLVLRDPRPHATIWILRGDAVRNPDQLVTVGLGADPGDDYASWSAPEGGRRQGSVAAFIETRLPAACR